MRFAQRLTLTLCAVLLSITGADLRAAPLLEISQDGKHFSRLYLVSGRETAMTYFAYANRSSHANYGSKPHAATAAFYWDLDRQRLSLLLTVGGKGGAGMVDLNIGNLPGSARLALSDNPGQYTYHRGSGTFAAQVSFKNETTGLILGRLEGNRATLKFTLKPLQGLTTLQVASGDPAAGGVLRPLDLSKPIFVDIFPFGGRHHANSLLADPIGPTPLFPRTVNAVRASGPTDPTDGNPVGSGVPEPATAAVWGLVLAVLSLRPRRGRTSGRLPSSE